MRTFYIKGKITEFYKAMLIEATSENEAIEIYENELLDGHVESDSSDLDIWNEVETIEQ